MKEITSANLQDRKAWSMVIGQVYCVSNFPLHSFSFLLSPFLSFFPKENVPEGVERKRRRI